ncbi:MAG TPA: hypothetical protein VJN21_14165 [Candidatus Acidoferrales bacterium]|nr:hypothetical protein [Candidatus Acidoferrales bacterium]
MPIGKSTMLNEPSLCDFVVTARPVFTFRAWTVAPTTTAFDWSVTVPLIDPSVCCARAAKGAVSASTQKQKISRPKLIFIVFPREFLMQVGLLVLPVLRVVKMNPPKFSRLFHIFFIHQPIVRFRKA